MGMKKKESPKEMTPNAGEPLGMERDNKGRAIPLNDRLPEDRAKAKAPGFGGSARTASPEFNASDVADDKSYA